MTDCNWTQQYQLPWEPTSGSHDTEILNCIFIGNFNISINTASVPPAIWLHILSFIRISDSPNNYMDISSHLASQRYESMKMSLASESVGHSIIFINCYVYLKSMYIMLYPPCSQLLQFLQLQHTVTRKTLLDFRVRFCLFSWHLVKRHKEREILSVLIAISRHSVQDTLHGWGNYKRNK